MIDAFQGRHRFLSNFIPCAIEMEGETYRSVEHAYQAAKTTHFGWRQTIRGCLRPGDAKRLGRQAPLRPMWEEMKEEIMLDLLRQKFSKPGMAAMLLATGDEELVEGNNWGDKYWGVCRGEGQNRLGNLLMQVRSELIASDSSVAPSD